MDAQINAFGGSNTTPKKRVLFIVTQSETGGAQEFILQFIKHASKESYDITVGIGQDGDGSFTKALAKLATPSFIIPSLRRNPDPIFDVLAIFRIRKLIRKFQPDALFLCSSKAGFIGSRAALPLEHPPKVIYRIGGWRCDKVITRCCSCCRCRSNRWISFA